MQLFSIFTLSFLFGAMAKPHPPKYNGKEVKEKVRPIWQPGLETGMRHDEFVASRGMGQTRFNLHNDQMKRLKFNLATKAGKEMPGNNDEFLDDVILTDRQLTALQERSQSRHRRKAIREEGPKPYYLWDESIPIGYMFDGKHSSTDEQAILSAIAHWEALTCVHFEEVSIKTQRHYLLFTNENTGCWSYISNISYFVSPQPVNLHSTSCLSKQLGTPVHELGHALGFFHEQTRYDRDRYIVVTYDNIMPEARINFHKEEANTMDTYGIPYDLSSIMHYFGRAYAVDEDVNTITSIDPLYQQSIGQRHGLSFYDAKLANLMYCSNRCSASLTCERGGYTDPNNCNVCRCPDGFGGALCELVAPSSEVCGVTNAGVVEVEVGQQTCIEVGAHGTDTSCNWLVQAPTGCQLKAAFIRIYELVSETNHCLDWIELKYNDDLQKPGPRFCGYTLPKVDGEGFLTSVDNEMMILLRSPYPSTFTRHGFKVCLETVGYCPSTKSTTNSTTTTTTPTPPPTTTTQLHSSVTSKVIATTKTQSTTTTSQPTTMTTQPSKTTGQLSRTFIQHSTTITQPTTTTKTQSFATTTQPATTNIETTKPTTQLTTTTSQPNITATQPSKPTTITTTRPTTITTYLTTTTSQTTITATQPSKPTTQPATITNTQPTTTTIQPTIATKQASKPTTQPTTTTTEPITTTTEPTTTTAQPTMPITHTYNTHTTNHSTHYDNHATNYTAYTTI